MREGSAVTRCSGGDGLDYQLREELTMAVPLALVLLRFELEADNLATFRLPNDACRHGGAFDIRSAYLDAVLTAEQQDTVQRDFVADACFQLLYAQRVLLGCTI